MKRITIGAGLTLLVSVFALVAVGALRPLENRFDGSVKELLPTPPTGWTKVERPIAESPEMRQAVNEKLNFDDAVFVDFSDRAGNRLSVYIAYWKAGKMATKEVATHTPDVCWVGNGWKRESGSKMTSWGAVKGRIPTAEAREFSIGGSKEYVLFWHVVGDQVVSYDQMESPPWYAPVVDIFRDGISLRQEQFFIRLSSPEPLDSENLRPLMDPLISQVRNLAPETLSPVGAR